VTCCVTCLLSHKCSKEWFMFRPDKVRSSGFEVYLTLSWRLFYVRLILLWQGCFCASVWLAAG
jgi:hypothetical protein